MMDTLLAAARSVDRFGDGHRAEGGDSTCNEQVRVCLEATLGPNLSEEEKELILDALSPYSGLFHLPGVAPVSPAPVEGTNP